MARVPLRLLPPFFPAGVVLAVAEVVGDLAFEGGVVGRQRPAAVTTKKYGRRR